MPERSDSRTAYKVVDLLLALRDLLREEPHTLKQISECLPEHYADDKSGARKLRRDLQYLERWGYQVVRDKTTKTYALISDRIEYG